ncbi:unnamed protein product [Fusarium venenatum]|uniref:Xylanolytic transcriptional activator regulatory domain-containing protein n=1 Tax=Fusarium venenatum TaxID=56646 RepID=A0A2L2T780_9HYPO|nr:uncharacterized protein FVRRES_12549 [Fusarium venenatum]CEI39858.1 unnamed protein product [Fusarium venenatum]
MMTTWVPEEVKSSLDALKRIVGRHDEQTASSKPAFSQIGVSKDDLKLPPVWLTMLAIQKVKDTPALDISCLLAFSDVSHFIDYLLDGYSEKASLIDLVILNCGLYEIFIHYEHIETDSALKEELLAAIPMCRHNLGKLLANLPLNLPCNIHTIRALLMTVYYHLGECEISLAWSHIAAAAQLCFKLGLHTDAHLGHRLEDTRSSRAMLFWLIYMIDKVVSLRLNRPFCIDDRNVSIGLDCIEGLPGKRLCVVVPKWIKISMIYGKVYLDLHSAKALIDTQDAREARARSLADELEAVFYSRDPVEDQLFESMGQKLGTAAVDIQRSVDMVSHLSCLTLIYRTIQPTQAPGSAFSEECLTTARECLKKQRICLAKLGSASPFSLDVYIEWAVMGWPFVPFVVVFCNTIENLDSSGLAELWSVIEPLKLIESILPTSYKKQLRLLVVMYDVASKYLSSQSDALSAAYMEPSFETPFNLLFPQVGMPVPGCETQMQQDFNVSPDDRTAGQKASLIRSAANQMNYHGLQEIDYGSQLGYWLECDQKLLQALEHRF